MRFKNSTYQKLVENQHKTIKEITILVTAYCEGGCQFCLYNKEAVGNLDWDALYQNTYEYLSLLDFDNQKAIIAFEGGELFSEKLLTDDYVTNLTKLIGYVHSLIVKSEVSYIAISVSLENIGDKGMKILQDLKKTYPKLHINVAFTASRIENDKKSDRFWKNMDALKSDQLGVGVLITEGFSEKNYLRRLATYTTTGNIDLAEAHQFDGFTFANGSFNASREYEKLIDLGIEQKPFLRRGIPSLHHLDIYITSNGVKNGFQLLRRPSWIPEDEWNRIRDDQEYRMSGYQQVLDWYGCNNCEYLYTCQGMLWTSYYAQKNLYNCNKCIYLDSRPQNRRLSHKRSMIIIPHTICEGKCSFCFLDRAKPFMINWDNLLTNVTNTLAKPDEYSSIFIMGGELFDPILVSDLDYVNHLRILVATITAIKSPECVISIPISLENITVSGIKLIREFKRDYGIRFNASFSTLRFNTKEKEDIFFSNFYQLKDVISSINIPMVEIASAGIDKRILDSNIKVFIEEPIILDKELGYSYKDIQFDWSMIDKEIHCLCNCTDIITPKGTSTCAGVTRKPIWIEDAEWSRLCNDREYLKEGYQQVLDWYGCDICEKQDTCPGMCWISYYAQKELYDNHNCLYKDKP